MRYFLRTLMTIVLGAMLIGASEPTAAALPQLPAILPSCPASNLKAISPFFHQDQTLYARFGDDLWRSTDGDATWQMVYQTSTEDLYVSSLLIAPIAREEGLHLYLTVGDRGGIVGSYSRTHSPDGGTTWEDRWTDSRLACWMAATNEEGTIFASCATLAPSDPADDGIHRSTDHGHTWQKVWSAGEGWEPVAPSPDFANDQTVYAIRNGLSPDSDLYPMVSTDGGLTWEDISPGLCLEPFIPWEDAKIRKIVVSPNFPNDQTLLGRAYSHLLKSEDGGASWQNLYPADEDPCQEATDSMWEMAFSPDYATDRTIFIRTDSGFYVSYDGSHHWRQLLSGRQLSGVIHVRRRPEPTYQLIYFPLLLQGITPSSTASYQVFFPLLTGSGNLPRSVPLTLFAEKRGEYAYVRSDDGGITWRCVNPPSSTLQNIPTQPGGGLP